MKFSNPWENRSKIFQSLKFNTYRPEKQTVQHITIMATWGGVQAGTLSDGLAWLRAAAVAHAEVVLWPFGKALALEEGRALVEAAHTHSLRLLAEVAEPASLALAETCGVDGFKLPSSELDDESLLNSTAALGKPTLLATKGRKRIEIYQAVKHVRTLQPALPLVLVPGQSDAPASLEMHSLEEIRWLCCAYADLGVELACADQLGRAQAEAKLFPLSAVGAGATWVEKQLAAPSSTTAMALDIESFRLLAENLRSIDTVGGFPAWGNERQRQQAKVQTPFPSIQRTNRTRPQVGILINVRTASTRLPQKALKKICGRESIALLIERMKCCNQANRIVLCTTERPDDAVLVELARREGIAAFCGPNEDVAQRLLLALDQFQFDHFVRVTGDDLLRDIGLIDEAIIAHLEHRADYTCMEGVVYGGDSEIISRRALATIVERAAVPGNTEFLTWYLDEPSAFVMHRLKPGADYYRPYRLSLDTPQDLEVLQAVFEALYVPGHPVDLREALLWLDHHPALAISNPSGPGTRRRETLDLRLWI